MPRGEPRPYWKKSHRQWYVKIDGTHYPLGRDKEAAWEEYHKLMAGRRDLGNRPLVLDLLEAFLAWCEVNRAPAPTTCTASTARPSGPEHSRGAQDSRPEAQAPDCLGRCQLAGGDVEPEHAALRHASGPAGAQLGAADGANLTGTQRGRRACESRASCPCTCVAPVGRRRSG